MTNRERELVAQALRLARKGMQSMADTSGSLNGSQVSGVSLVVLLPEQHHQLCDVLRRLLLSRPARGHKLLERLACLN